MVVTGTQAGQASDIQHSTAWVSPQAGLHSEMIIENTINVYSKDQIDQILREEFHEDEGDMEEAVQGLQEWISSCPHLVNSRQDKEFLR